MSRRNLVRRQSGLTRRIDQWIEDEAAYLEISPPEFLRMQLNLDLDEHERKYPDRPYRRQSAPPADEPPAR